MSIKISNVTKVALIQFFSTLYFYLPILTIYYQQRGLNFIQINSLWGIITGTIFIAEVPTGVIADKIGRKKSIIIALILQLIGEVLFLFSQNYLHFILISVIAGLGFAFQSGCTQALVFDSLKEENNDDTMKQAMGKIGAYYQIGSVVGALASSIIIAQLTQFRIVLAIIFTIISVGIALSISFSLKEPKLEYKHEEKSPLKLMSEAMNLIRNNASFKRIILLGVFTTPFVGYLRSLHPPYFQLSGIAPVWLGITLAIGGILGAFASRYSYKMEDIFGVKKGMFIATILPALFYFLMAFFLHPIFAILFFILNFGLMNIQEPLFSDYYNRHIKSDSRATTLSAINMISSIYIALIGLVIGWVADYSILYAFVFMGIVILLGVILFRINDDHVKVNET